jgi:hypothetical protein
LGLCKPVLIPNVAWFCRHYPAGHRTGCRRVRCGTGNPQLPRPHGAFSLMARFSEPIEQMPPGQTAEAIPPPHSESAARRLGGASQRDVPGGYRVKEATGRTLGHFNSWDDAAVERLPGALTRDEARFLAENFARLENLLSPERRSEYPELASSGHSPREIGSIGLWWQPTNSIHSV